MTGTSVDHSPWQGTLDYIGIVERAIQSWNTFFADGFSDWYREDEIKKWMSEIEMTFEVLKYQYIYDTSSTLSISPLASGFPERYHIHRLCASPASENGAKIASLKRAALDDLFSNGSVNHWFLEQIAKAKVENLLSQASVLASFRVWSFEKVEDKGDDCGVYRICFERFCYRNLPSLYLMLFECRGENAKDIQEELSKVLEEETSRLPLLGNLAEVVDQAIAPVSPVWIGRLLLGPLFISGLTRDEHALQKALDAARADGEMAVASRIIFEYVMSDGGKTTTRLFDAAGRKHEMIQEYAVRQFDDECEERRVSFVEKFLFAPHRVSQMLDEEFRQKIGHRLITTE